jgi:hypothetical protein
MKKGDIVRSTGKGKTKSWGHYIGTITKVNKDNIFVIWDGTTFEDQMNIEEVEQRGELFVKFQTVDSDGKVVELVRKVGTTQKVSNTAGVVSRRYVIKEKLKIGGIEKEVLINLNDRTKMEYKFLIGRNVLLGRFIVDVARSHVLGD